MSDRERSASPAREPKPKKQKTGGFKWKEKRSRDDDTAKDERGGGRLERGYRERSPRRDSYRDRSPKRDSYRDRDREDKDRVDDRSEPRKDTDSYRPSRPDPDTPSAQPPEAPSSARRDPFADSTNPSESKPKPKKEKKPKPTPTPSGPMIVVNINDRLGTKAAIPCLASDSIKAFKAIVAAHIGRQPHEIMLKRQGERPFKDQLTLEDYGVSNGVQLDLELDTGD